MGRAPRVKYFLSEMLDSLLLMLSGMFFIKIYQRVIALCAGFHGRLVGLGLCPRMWSLKKFTFSISSTGSFITSWQTFISTVVSIVYIGTDKFVTSNHKRLSSTSNSLCYDVLFRLDILSKFIESLRRLLLWNDKSLHYSLISRLWTSQRICLI